MKKVIICLLTVVALFTITACGKKEETSTTNKKQNGVLCKKKFDYQSLEYVAIVENDELTSFNIITSYEYDDLESMKNSCNSNQKEAKEVNAKNIYVKYNVTCNEKNKTITIEKEYDTEKSMKEKSIKNMLSYVYNYIQEDNKFDTKGWKESNIKDGFTCDK